MNIENLNRKFLSPDEDGGGYGYAEETVSVSPFSFGLNAGVTYLKKFEWINNAGKDGAEMEALDVVFNINGKDKNYRVFPVKKAYGKNNVEVTDPNAPEFKDAVKNTNARISHILKALLPEDFVKTSLGRPFKGFKDYCQHCMTILPKDFAERKLDIFMQFQWQISTGQNRTFLDIPTKMNQGKWLCAAVEPVGGDWKEVRKESPDDKDQAALTYVDGAGNIHPFVKTGWFVNSNYAKLQRDESDTSGSGTASDADHNAGTGNEGGNTEQGAAPAGTAW